MKQFKERIIGWINKSGTFNDNQYDNIYLVVVLEENGVPIAADSKNYKFKKSDCDDVLGFAFSPDSLDDLRGQIISKSYFDKYGKLVGVDYE